MFFLQAKRTNSSGKRNMKKEFEDKKELVTTDVTENAVQVIKAAILQSQQRALKAINQEQLTLYYGIVRYVSANIIRQAKQPNLQKLTGNRQF